MKDRIQESFDRIRAEEALKEKTKQYISQKRKDGGRAKRPVYRTLLPVAACLALLLLGGRWFYFTPTAAISIDINPSIELGINRMDRVISVEGYNEDGEELAGKLHLRHKNYEDAVEELLENEQVTALLSSDETMSIAVVGEKEQSVRVLSGVEHCTRSHHNAHCYAARPEEMEEAHSLGLSYGKYNMYLELRSLGADITPEEVQSMTMRELRELADALSESTDYYEETQTDCEQGRHREGCGHGTGGENSYQNRREHHGGGHHR